MEQQGLHINTKSTCGIRCGNIATELQHSLTKLDMDNDITYVLSTSKNGIFGNANVKESLSHHLSPVDLKLSFDLEIQEDLIIDEVSRFLNKGHVVICNQFNVGKRSMHSLQKQLADRHNGQLFAGQENTSIQPDLTFVLNNEPLQALDSTLSAESTQTFSDSAIDEFHDRTHVGLVKRAGGFPERIKLLDASHPKDQLIQQTIAYVFNTLIIDAEGKKYH